MSSIPSGLPTIGPASVILLSQQGINSAADVLREGIDGHEGLPGMGPAKWAVLMDWALASVSDTDVHPPLQRYLQRLEELETRLRQEIGANKKKSRDDLEWAARLWRSDLLVVDKTYQCYLDAVAQPTDRGAEILDTHYAISQVRSRILQQIDTIEKEPERRAREQALARKKQYRDGMLALKWMLRMFPRIIGGFWLLALIYAGLYWLFT